MEDADAFLAAARETLAWTDDAGFEDVRCGVGARRGSGVRALIWWLWSPHARIWIGACPAWCEVDVAVGPPRPRDAPWVTRDYDLVALEALRHARGLSVMRRAEVHDAAPGDHRPPVERFRAFVSGLADLRATELAGDWSRLDDARAALPDVRRAFRAPWRDGGEATVTAEGVTLCLDRTEVRAINNALNWVVNGVGAEDPARWAGLGLSHDRARATFAAFRAATRDDARPPGGSLATVAFAWPELRFVADAVVAVLPAGRHRIPDGDMHPLTGVHEEQMAAVAEHLQGLVA